MSSSTGHAVSVDPVHVSHSPHQPPARDEIPRRSWQQKYRQPLQQPHPPSHHHHSPQQQQQPAAVHLMPSALTPSVAGASYSVVESLHQSPAPVSRGRGRARSGRGRHAQIESHNGPNQQQPPQHAPSHHQQQQHQQASGDTEQREAIAHADEPLPPRFSDSARGTDRRRGRGGRRGGGAVATFNLTLSERARLAGHTQPDDSHQPPHHQPSQPQQQRQQRHSRQRAHPAGPTSSAQPPPAAHMSLAFRPDGGASRPPHSQSVPSFPSASTLSAHMTARLQANTYECCICNELIRPSQAVWSCGACYVLLHHRCVERWWNVKRVAQGSLGGAVSWPCAGCLSMQVGAVREYRCFCGKIEQPDTNPYITPHSCGQPCGKRRTAAATGPHACPHLCTQPCHPGPCSPCTVVLTRSCGCGRGAYQIRCGVNDASAETCGEVCNKQLACGRHRCQQTCHLGPCDACSVVVKQTCWCEKEETERVCGSDEGADEHNRPRYSCLRSCDHLLDCGTHRCRQLCHPSSHPTCSRLPATPQPCACGRSLTDVKRSACTDPLPTCGNRCSKLLQCGAHYCDRRCHDGECGECTAMLRRPCRCGNETVAMPCKLALEAERVKQQTISEHLADGVEPPANDELEQLFVCDRACNARLGCGQHKCPNRCCPPSASHLCMRLCDKPLACGHHRCDEHCHGQTPCPPCSVVIRQPLVCECGRTRLPANQPCGTALKCPYPCSRVRSCGHACVMVCHEGSCDSIAPCAVLTERLCGGGHRLMKNIPCYATSASCGVTCRKLLTCGQHTCLRPCHAGQCMDGAEADVVATCGQKCGKVRVSCVHACKAPCHPGLPCPDVLCEEAVVVKCACGRKSRTGRCNTSDFYADDSLAVSCDEQCEVEQRNARLRDALAVEPGRPVLPYPSALMQAVLDRVLLDFCARSERKLNDWLDDARQPTKHFPSMKSDQRWLLHQLAAYYRLTAESIDQPPNRSVRFIRQPHSAIPLVSLSAATRTFVNGKTAKGGGGAVGVDEAYLLHFVGLTVQPALSVGDVRMMLHDWEGKLRLNWLDDDHAIATFDERSVRDRAKERLLTRGMWRDVRDERSGAAEADAKLEAGSACLYRKVAMNESGQLQGVSRDREKKRLVTGHDGFTAVVTVRRGGAGASSASPDPSKPAASAPSTASSRLAAAGSTDSVASRRPVVTLKGLKQLQRQHAADDANSDARSAGSPSASPQSLQIDSARRDSTRSKEDSETEQQQHADSRHSRTQPQPVSEPPAATSSARSSAAPTQPAMQSVVGLYVPAVEGVKRDNRWAALMDDEQASQEDTEWEAAGQSRASRRRQQRKKASERAEQGAAADKAEAEEGADAAAAESDDWEQAAGQSSRSSRRNQAAVSSAADHSAW